MRSKGPGRACGFHREAPEDAESGPNRLLKLPTEPGGRDPACPVLRTSQNLVSPELGPALVQDEGAECLVTVPSAWGPLLACPGLLRLSLQGQA